MKEDIVSRYNFKEMFKYISTVISWTIFTLLIIIAVLLIYYYVSVRLYAKYGDKFEPKFSVYTIVSESMEPNVNKFDVIINSKVKSIDDVKTNDVITFISTSDISYGLTVTHRVVGTKLLDDGNTCLITRGDNNTSEDTSCVKKENLIGVVKAVIPSLGKIQFLMASKFSLIFLIGIPALYIIVKDILKLFMAGSAAQEIDIKNKNKKSKNLEEAYEDLKRIKNKKR